MLQSQILADEIKKKYFTSSFGTYSKDSGLYKNIVGKGVSTTPSSATGGVELGSNEDFVTSTGQPVTIRPKKAKALAIPTTREAYYMQKGVTSLRSIQTLKRVKGGLDTDTKKEGMPMFVLRKSMTIRPKVNITEIAAEYAMPITVAIKKAVFNALKGI